MTAKTKKKKNEVSFQLDDSSNKYNTNLLHKYGVYVRYMLCSTALIKSKMSVNFSETGLVHNVFRSLYAKIVNVTFKITALGYITIVDI